MRPGRFLLVDGQPIFLEGLAAALAVGWPGAVVAKAETPAQALEDLDAAPDIVVADFELFADGADLRRFVQAAAPGLVLVLSTAVKAETIAAAIEAGVRGFLPRTMSGEGVRGAITVALHGGVCFPTQGMVDAPSLPARERVSRGKRELEILQLLDKGSSNKAIARELGLSVATVKLHVQSILRTTGARNRVEATINARRMGILPPSL